MLSSSKSPNNADNVSNKRKVLSPLGSESPKVRKLATKKNSDKSVHEKGGEDKGGEVNERKLDSSNDSVEIISDDEKRNLEQSDQQKMWKGDGTPKRGKNKKLDRSQQKPGTLTKFLKRTNREIEESDISHNNLSELKDKKDDQDTIVHKENNDICSNESSGASFNSSELQSTSQLNETDNHVTSKDADLQESDCDILSSDNETSSELDKSILNRSKETPDKSATPVTPKTDKETKNKIKKLTPKQLEKKQEMAKRKEEKLKLRIVCMHI